MYSAKEAAAITGLSTSALRYYEKEGLLPQISRTAQKYRQYSNNDIEWIKMIQCLRSANVPVRSIKEYAALLRQGGKTLEERYIMVRNYKKEIERQLKTLENALALTQNKLSFYEKLLNGSQNKNMTFLEEWHLFKTGGNENT